MRAEGGIDQADVLIVRECGQKVVENLRQKAITVRPPPHLLSVSFNQQARSKFLNNVCTDRTSSRYIDKYTSTQCSEYGEIIFENHKDPQNQISQGLMYPRTRCHSVGANSVQ